ncbi:MAG: trypsin-like serine protease [Pseudobdellovibrionaceae bacterium]
MKKLILPLFLTLAFVGCRGSRMSSSLSGQQTAIINGEPVAETDPSYAMTARLLMNVSDVWIPICTVSILAEDLILTAAHCVEDTEATDLRIAFGAQPLSFTNQMDSEKRIDVLAKFKTSQVKEFVSHPLYGISDYDQDMALIRIEQPVPEGFQAAPLLSNEQMKAIKEGENYEVLLAGYGLVQEDPIDDSEILRQTKVSAQFEGLHLVTDQTKGSGGCHGDSGGPAYLTVENKMYLVGVTHGPKNEDPDCHHQGVWGNPNHEKDFLNQAAEKMGAQARFQ